MLRTIICVGCDSSRLAAPSTILRNGGYAVLTATNLEEALRLLDQQVVDLLILDQTFAETNGLLASMLHCNHGIPVLLVHSGDEDGVRADAYFNLADLPADLLDAVASIVGRQSTQPHTTIVECSGIGHFSRAACSSL